MKDEIMESPDRGKIVFDRSVIDFVTVAVEFCAFLENEEKMPRSKWVDRMLKILPILYVKALLSPDVISSDEDLPATFVREEDYNRVASSVANIMGEENVYLDVLRIMAGSSSRDEVEKKMRKNYPSQVERASRYAQEFFGNYPPF